MACVVTNKLRLLWSPEQIAGWLKHTYPCDESFHVSHETIYRSLFDMQNPFSPEFVVLYANTLDLFG